MKKLTEQLKSISRSLSTLSEQVDKALKEVDKLKPAKAAPARKKKVAEKKPVAKRKAPAEKAAPRKKAPAGKKKVVAKKPVAKRIAPARQITVLDTVLNAIQRTKKGVTIAKLKEKTKLDPRQLSNALYKLANKGLIVAKARGLYAKK